MPTQRLVIDGDDKGRFYLAVQDGALTVGAGPAPAGAVLGKLRVRRIHCELEVDEGPVTICNDCTTAGAPPRNKEVQLGEEFQIGPAHLLLVAPPGAPAPPKPAAAPTPPIDPAGQPTRLVVIDGADKGRSYPLVEVGCIPIGKSQKHAEIVLHDMYVERVHCELHRDSDGHVRVKHLQGKGTQINGKEISEQELYIGDVLRVGNSYLRFEIGAAEVEKVAEDDEPLALEGAKPAAAAPKAPTAASLTLAADPLAQIESHVLGQYEFGELLGRGFTGLVFRATHRQSGQEVALKVLSPEFPQTDAELQQFIRTVKVVAPLRHPHLVTLYTAGKTGRYCWIARELVEGESLAALIQRLKTEGKLGWKRACRVAIHLGKVLNYLHQHQVVPGRLTPANILIQNETRLTKLADILLDQALQGSRIQEIIREKQQLAVLPYCAPEQIEPTGPTDLRSALYSLGAVVYALLTSQPPFSGATTTQISARIRDANVMKPSKTLPDTPPPFEAAVLKLLAKKPEDRFQTAEQFLEVVEPVASLHDLKA
jgi:hypothetical protein